MLAIITAFNLIAGVAGLSGAAFGTLTLITRRRIYSLLATLACSVATLSFGVFWSEEYGRDGFAIAMMVVGSLGLLNAIVFQWIWKPKYLRDSDAQYYRD